MFDLNNQAQVNFIKDRLLRLKPRDDGGDVEGFVYVYYRAIDDQMVKAHKLSHIILYKVGRTKRHPARRIQE